VTEQETAAMTPEAEMPEGEMAETEISEANVPEAETSGTEPMAAEPGTTPESEPIAAESDEQPVAAADVTPETPAGPAAPESSAATEAAEATQATAPAEPAVPAERARKGASSRKAAAAEQDDAAPAAPSGPRGLRIKYANDVVPALVKQFEYANPNQVPRIQKIVVNVGLGEALTNAKAIDAAAGDITMITGQKPIVMKARRSIAQFKIRTGNPIGLKVTLRGQRMWDFLERLSLLALPRIRDFRGIPSRSFDGRGNYTLGLREQIAFPEIDYDKVDRLRGLEVSIVTTAKSDEESKRLLELLGMPFAS
jgi:large subunit ribosomal protein L5